MMNAVRLGFRHQLFHPASNPLPKPYLITNKPHIRFAQSSSGPNQTDQEMDPKKQSSDPQSKTTDSMSSFGEGYATRSDEEGFGGTYHGGEEDDKKGHTDEKLDHNQGSDVKEKEKARHQSKVGN